MLLLPKFEAEGLSLTNPNPEPDLPVSIRCGIISPHTTEFNKRLGQYYDLKQKQMIEAPWVRDLIGEDPEKEELVLGDINNIYDNTTLNLEIKRQQAMKGVLALVGVRFSWSLEKGPYQGYGIALRETSSEHDGKLGAFEKWLKQYTGNAYPSIGDGPISTYDLSPSNHGAERAARLAKMAILYVQAQLFNSQKQIVDDMCVYHVSKDQAHIKSDKSFGFRKKKLDKYNKTRSYLPRVLDAQGKPVTQKQVRLWRPRLKGSEEMPGLLEKILEEYGSYGYELSEAA